MAESEHKEVAWREGLKHVEGSPDLALGLLREHTRRGVVEDGDEGERGGVELGGDGGLGGREGNDGGGGDAEVGRGGGVEEGLAEEEEEEDGGGEGGSEEGEETRVGGGRVFLPLGGGLEGLENPRLHGGECVLVDVKDAT